IDRTAELARRRFGLSVHFGAGSLPRRTSLSVSYQAALAAAESALARESRLVVADAMAYPRSDLLRRLRSELAEKVEQRPGELRARFERYTEVMASECSYRLE